MKVSLPDLFGFPISAMHPLLLLSASVVMSSANATTLSLNLQEVVSAALSSNRSLLASKLSLESERYSIDVVRAEFEPKIGPAVSIGRVGDSNLFPGGGVNNSYGIMVRKKFETGTSLYGGPSYNRAADASNTTMNLAVTQPLLKGAGAEFNMDGVHRAEFSVAAAKLKLEQARTQIVLETIVTFYEVDKQKQIVELYRALSEALSQHVMITRSKEKAGLAGSMDAYRAEISQKDAQEALSQAESAYLVSRGKLKYLMSMNQDSDVELIPNPAPVVKLNDAEAEAESANFELVQAQADLEEAERITRVADDDTLPELNLQLSYGQGNRSDPFLAQYIPTTYKSWNVSLQSSTDLFRSAEKSNYKKSIMMVEVARANLQQKKDEIRRQVRQQLSYISACKERAGLREAQIKQAEGKLALAEVKFRNGMADNFTIIETQTELQNARVGLLNEEAEYALSIYRLAAISGHLLDGYFPLQLTGQNE
jgi:outer membrane protein TolC